MTPSKLNLHSLIVFYFVASEQGMTSAADKLCLTQPTVTYHIRSLESNIGVRLLDIKKKKVFLTPAGEGLFRYVTEIYRHMTGAEKFLESLKESQIRVGMSTTFSSVVTAAVVAFEELLPDVKLIVKSATSFEIAEDVLNSELDLGVVASMDYMKPELKVIPLSEREKLVLVASPSSSISQKGRVDLADLCGYPLISGPETSAARQVILNRFKSEGLEVPPLIAVEVNSTEWGMRLVENGEGMGVYHIRSVEKEIAEGRLKALPLAEDIWVGVEALLRKDAPEHPMAERFVPLLREAFGNNVEKPANTQD